MAEGGDFDFEVEGGDFDFEVLEGNVNDFAEARFQRRSFELVKARFYDMLGRISPSPNFDRQFNELLYEREKIEGWLLDSRGFFSQFSATEDNEEFEKEKEELNSMLETILQCREVEKMRRAVEGKLIRVFSIFRKKKRWRKADENLMA